MPEKMTVTWLPLFSPGTEPEHMGPHPLSSWTFNHLTHVADGFAGSYTSSQYNSWRQENHLSKHYWPKPGTLSKCCCLSLFLPLHSDGMCFIKALTPTALRSGSFWGVLNSSQRVFSLVISPSESWFWVLFAKTLTSDPFENLSWAVKGQSLVSAACLWKPTNKAVVMTTIPSLRTATQCVII